ncbi:O-antigen ligase family protein [Accumulibacter sp.]|uniref:O-antigen ligase family protein n=1 Tax=Accumulibacter sp. TaxID=2053492 RepID=UPI0028C422A2|nr:O-antigen ligase family protein [Accumulibacter sp.]
MKWLHAALAALAAVLGVVLALHHPLSPMMLAGTLVAWSITVYLRPDSWLFVLPALLPVAGFSPWTGWIGVEEFDLLVLGAVAGCYARTAFASPWCRGRTVAVAEQPGKLPEPAHLTLSLSAMGTRDDGFRRRGGFRLAAIGLGLLSLSYALALARGLLDAGGVELGWFQAYADPLNSLRTGKSFLFAMLLLPSLRCLLQNAPALAVARLAGGLATGLGLVSLAIVCERAAYPGLLDLSTPYRTTALFWEMHVGGAALDGFLALTIPFVVHAVARAPGPLRWLLAAALAVIAGYACLTSFSRGVYLGVGGALVVLAYLMSRRWRWQRRSSPAADPSFPAPGPLEAWRVWGNRLLVLALIVEVVAVLALGDFMGRRLSASERDLGGRLQHWSEGLSLLRGPSEWLLGRGLGRFPANYSQAVPGRELPGSLRVIDDEGEGDYLRIFGSRREKHLRGAFELLQRLPSIVEGSYQVSMDWRASQPAALGIRVCPQHLLYAVPCGHTAVVVHQGDQQWRRFSLSLTAQEVYSSSWRLPGLAFLALRLDGPAHFIDVDNLSIVDAQGRELLHNGDFSDGLAHWFFAGRHYFVPWHIDNLFLEMLIDQGAIGLLLLVVLLAMAFANLLGGRGRAHELAPYLLASLAACLVVGVFSSLLDMPRSAYLFFLLLCLALFLDAKPHEDASGAPLSPPPRVP